MEKLFNKVDEVKILQITKFRQPKTKASNQSTKKQTKKSQNPDHVQTRQHLSNVNFRLRRVEVLYSM